MKVGDLVSIPDGRSGPRISGILLGIRDNPSDVKLGMERVRRIVDVWHDGQIWTAWKHRAQVLCKNTSGVIE